MPTDECPQCVGHTKLDCIRDQFTSKLSDLLQNALGQLSPQVPEDTVEVNERKATFPIELADHLLWLAASIYSGEGYRGSEAIFELAKALEGVDCDDEEALEEGKPVGARLVPSSDVN